MADRFSVDAVFTAIDNITKPLGRMRRTVGNFSAALNRNIATANNSLDNLGRSAVQVAGIVAGALTGATYALAAATLSLVKAAMTIEDSEAAFTPLLGSAERAKEMVAAINKTAAETPFQFENLSSVTSQLLPVMNGEIETTIETMKMLGDTAGGNAEKLDTITRGYTKAMLKGKTDMEALNMIAEAGVPIYTELAKSMSMDVGEDFFAMISAGEISVDHLNGAFKRMTSEGGIFFEGMVIASRTQSGLWSTLLDNVNAAQAMIGEKLLPHTKALTQRGIEVAQRVQEWVNANSELIDQKLDLYIRYATDNMGAFLEIGKGTFQMLGGLIGLWVALKFAVLAARLALFAFNVVSIAFQATLITLTIALRVFRFALIAFRVAVAAARTAMLLFNLALYANPIGAVVGLVTLLVAGAAALIAGWGPLSEFFEGLWGKIKTYAKQGVDFLIKVLNVALAPMKLLISGAGKLFKAYGGEGPAPLPGGVVTGGDVTAAALGGSSSYAEVTLRDETGRAQVTDGDLGDNINLVDSGGI